MVDATNAMEGENLTADMVAKSPTKKLVILGAGKYAATEFDGKTVQKLELPIEIDGKRKLWRPNKDSAASIGLIYGKDTDNWVGKIIILSLSVFKGKQIVHGMPMINVPVVTVTSENI